MKIALKALPTSARETSAGICLAGDDKGKRVKKSRLCFEGQFDGVYGKVVVTAELLNGIAALYNKIKENPQNENDYSPVLVDHNRLSDLIKGRILGGLWTEMWFDPRQGKEVLALYGNLRIDDDEAFEKVEKGQYAHLSISFDEESFELFEVSFVAVEAARGAILLQQGEQKMDLAQQLAALNARHKALQQRRKASLAVRKAATASLATQIKGTSDQVTALSASVQKVATELRTSSLKASFETVLREGKMTKAEFDKLNLSELAALPQTALSAVLGSYQNRQPSTDAVQFGQAAAKPVAMEGKSPAQIRAAMKAQLAGKTSLAEGEEPSVEKKEKDAAADDKGGAPDLSQISEALKSLDEISGVCKKMSEFLKSMSDENEKLAGEDKKEEDEKEAE